MQVVAACLDLKRAFDCVERPATGSMVNGLPQRGNANANCSMFQQTDDVFVLCYDRNYRKARVRLLEKISQFEQDCSAINLKLNPIITRVSHFGRTRQYLLISHSGSVLQQKQQIRYLGRIISNKNSKYTQRVLCRRQNPTCAFISLLGGCNNIPTKDQLLHRVFVRSRLEYDCFLLNKMSKAPALHFQECPTSGYIQGLPYCACSIE